MNWRRGLKRLYAVCTIAWIVLAVAIAANSYHSARYWDLRSIHRELETDQKAFKEVHPVYLDADGNAVPAPDQSEWVDVLESKPGPGSARRKLAVIRAQKLADTEKRFALATAALKQNSVVGAFKPPQLRETVGLIAIPPLAVAVAYLVLKWIISGFRRDPVPPSAA